MILLQEIHKGADWRYQIDADYDIHAESTSFRLGSTEAKVAATGTPDAAATVAWGAYTGGHTLGTIAITHEQSTALTLGLYYWEVISTGSDISHLAKGGVQVVL